MNNDNNTFKTISLNSQYEKSVPVTVYCSFIIYDHRAAIIIFHNLFFLEGWWESIIFFIKRRIPRGK